jgi:hypothetical protein
MFRKVGIALLTVAISSPLMQAQMRAMAARPGSLAGPSFGVTRGVSSRFARRSQTRPVAYPAFLWGDPYLYAGYPSEPVVAPAPAPQVVVVQVPSAAPAEAPEPPKPESLLIEWQGDRYVRLSGATGAAEKASHAQLDYAEPGSVKSPSSESASAAVPVPQEPRPAVLVYRDGHREELRSYTIAGGTIYAQGNYWTDGYWNKKIQLTALNLPATEQASQQSGAKFVLPTSPNEVIVGP